MDAPAAIALNTRPAAQGMPAIPTRDWDALGRGDIEPEIDLEELAEEEIAEDEDDDDNPYQDSDEALPDDEEEAAIGRDPSREGTRFDED